MRLPFLRTAAALPLALAVAACFAPLPSPAATWYVDALASAGGDGSEAAPFRTIREGVLAAGAGDEVLVRGGPSRTYSVASDADAIPVPAGKEGLALRAWGGEGRANVAVSDTYVADGNRAHVVSNAAPGVTISGLSFSFGPASFGVQNVGGCSAIAVDARDCTVEDCAFVQSSPSKYLGTGMFGANHSTYQRLLDCKTTAASNLVVRGCAFVGTRPLTPNNAYDPIYVSRIGRVEGCVFSNCCGTVALRQQARDETGAWVNVPGYFNDGTLHFTSNVVYGAANGTTLGTCGALRGIYPGPKLGEVAYNVFVALPGMKQGGNLDQDLVPYAWISLAQYFFLSAAKDAQPLIHHNTFVGGTYAILAWNGSGTSRRLGMFSNLFLPDEGGAALGENEISISGNRPTTFVSPSFFRNNACLGNLNGGTATEIDGYDLSAGLAMADNVQLAAAPTFLDVKNPFSEDFYRPLAQDATAFLAKAGWTGDDGRYPKWIGARKPMTANPTVLVFR